MAKLTPLSWSVSSASIGLVVGSPSATNFSSLVSPPAGSSGAPALSAFCATLSSCLRVFFSALSLAARTACSFFDFGAVSGGAPSH